MKRFFAIMLLVLLTLPMVSCATQNPMKDSLTASRDAGSIEIRVYPSGDKDFVDYAITDRQSVREICDKLSSLSLEKVKITEPIAASYSIRFCNASGVPIHSITVISGKNVIDYDGEQLYSVQDDFDVHAYIAGLVESAIPCNP